MLVHLAADTDPAGPAHLGPWLDDDLAELREAVAAVDDGQVVVVTQIDRSGPGGYERAVVGGPVLPTIDEDVPPAEALRSFLELGVRTFPARHLAVVVWGHGKGWRNAGEAPDAGFSLGPCGGGIAWDDHPPGVVDTPALQQALQTVREHTGRPIDVYAADACLMQTLEVATALADTARFLVGSEQIGSYLGLPYRELIAALAASRAAPADACDAGDEACRIAWLVPELVGEAFAPDGRHRATRPDDAETLTISTVEAGAMAALSTAMRGLGPAIEAWLAARPIRVIGLRQLLRDCNLPDFLCGSRDVGVLLDHLRALVQADPDETLLAAIDDARRRLDAALVHARFGARYAQDCEVDNLCMRPCHRGRAGLSVWLPHDGQEWIDRREAYAGSPIAGWDRWLDAVWPPLNPP